MGSGLGEVSEIQMMQDIIRNGPISVEFLASEAFANYQSGILSEKGIQDLGEEEP